MTKNLLLSAAAVSALLFAGAATAGEITNATGGALVTRTIASEVDTPATGFAGTISAATVMDNAVAVPAGATATYTVEYTLEGAEFVGAPTITTVGDSDVDGQGGTVYIRTDGSAVAIITVDNAGGASADLAGFSITGDINIAAKGDVKLSSTVSVVNGSLNLEIDEATAATLINFKPMIKGVEATSKTALALLPDYTTFADGSTPPVGVDTAEMATAIVVTSNDGDFFEDVDGSTPITAEDIIVGIEATVSGAAGAQLDVLDVDFGTSTAVVGTPSDTSYTVELSPADLSDVLDGTGVAYALVNADEVALNGIKYSVALAPEYDTGYSAVTALSPVAAGEVTLEGTNFVAPWMVLNNANNTATLRLANNGTVDTGPVFVTLTANNGATPAARTRVKVADSIAAGSAVEFVGSALAGLLGTTAQNGDITVTIEGDGSVISGKVRVRNISGATFEQSLGNLESN